MKILISILYILMVFGCTKEESNIHDQGVIDEPNTDTSEEITPRPSATPESEIVEPTQEHRIIDGTRPELQLLSTSQIRNHLKCIDPRYDLTKVQAESIMAIGDEPNQGTNAFLLPNLYSVGDDIIQKNIDLIDGELSLTKTGTKLNTPSLDYLVALSNIANVVGHNCEILQKSNNSIDSNACDCKTVDGITKIVDECLVILNLSDENRQLLKDEFQEQCNTDPKAAISSLIASWGYVISP